MSSDPDDRVENLLLSLAAAPADAGLRGRISRDLDRPAGWRSRRFVAVALAAAAAALCAFGLWWWQGATKPGADRQIVKKQTSQDAGNENRTTKVESGNKATEIVFRVKQKDEGAGNYDPNHLAYLLPADLIVEGWVNSVTDQEVRVKILDTLKGDLKDLKIEHREGNACCPQVTWPLGRSFFMFLSFDPEEKVYWLAHAGAGIQMLPYGGAIDKPLMKELIVAWDTDGFNGLRPEVMARLPARKRLTYEIIRDSGLGSINAKPGDWMKKVEELKSMK